MASMLKSVDDCFGRILDELGRLGLAGNTVVIFNSDNGGNVHSNVPDTAKTAKAEKSRSSLLTDWRKWAGDQPPTMNTPLRDGKGTLYEGGTRVPLMWSWPGHIKPGTTSDAVVGHIDLYPTLLDLLGLPRPAQQRMDGVSYARVLKSESRLDRNVFYNYFPHGQSPGRAGGVWVRSGDLKLIRWFGVPAADPGRYELYNLRDDLGETKNLAPTMPGKVKEFDALIDRFLADTDATYPKPNPAYKAQPTTSAAAVTDPVSGWVPKRCKVKVTDGVVRVEADGPAPFLATVRVKQAGPAVLKLRARAGAAGAGKVQWRTANQANFPPSGQTAAFHLPGGDWREVAVVLPAEGTIVHLRLFLPAQSRPVEVDWIELGGTAETSAARPTRWGF
jgi:hypothetical protein